MPTAIVAEVAEARQLDYERWQFERNLRTEATDQTERLASPMVNTFEYSLRPEGLVTDLGEPMRPVLEGGHQSAVDRAKVDTQWIFQAKISEIECEEYNQSESYARQIGEGLRITSQSLDGSDYEAMRAVAAALGHRLPMERPSSEDILQNRMWIPEGLVVLSPIPDAVRVDGIDIGGYNKQRQMMIVRIITATGTPMAEHQALIDRIRNAYDDVLTARTGKKHYAGRIQMSNEDARTFIEKQGDLLDAHMSIVNRVFAAARDPDERNAHMAPHRYNLAAALDDRLHGRQVDDLASAGDNARAEGKEFEGNCPTAQTAVTAGQQAERLGYRVERWSEGICANCERTTKVWKKEDGGCNICHVCADADTWHGRVGMDAERQKAVQERAKQQRRQALAQKIGKASARQAVRVEIEEKQSAAQVYTERLVVGGTVKEKIPQA